MSRRSRLITVARRAWPLPILVIAFLTLGLPHWLVDRGPDASNTEEAFAKLCRVHGGTPTQPRSAADPTTRQLCSVSYGDRAGSKPVRT